MPRLRDTLLALLLAAPLAGCGDAPPDPMGVAAWDRDAARREVLGAALSKIGGEGGRADDGSFLLVDAMLQPCRTYDEDFEPPKDRAANLVPLPDGRRMFKPRVENLAADTLRDWIAHSAPVPTPKDLPTTQRIVLRAENESEPHDHSPKPSAYVVLSDVGFSPTHDEALVHGVRSTDGSSSGMWLLLRREGAGWMVAQRARTFIACGGPSTVITPTER